ncbi:MAG: polysaccharide deacetylase family protein [Defluviitaleaceae bacterium]|nr:polysaccharide deacetylase family protein [Defluviitaleaceae bacterium]
MKKICKFLICFIILAACQTYAYADSWGLHFTKDNERPQGNATAEYLAQFDAYFIGCENEKVLYMTFDAGYENDLTAGILDTLKKHEVPAAFFLVGTYIRDHPELILRMAEEGHIVANHTMTHPDMSKLNDKSSFAKELSQVEEHYKNVTGQDIPKFYRPPRGIYNETNLKLAKELGYKTIFWSAAYKDWEDNNQPSREEAFSKLIPRTHPGGIILLHNTSKTNAKILDELLTRYKDMGYRLESLFHLIEKGAVSPTALGTGSVPNWKTP